MVAEGTTGQQAPYRAGDDRLIRADADGNRKLRRQRVDADLIVAGGGLSGVCCAVAAAREGVRVALVQDRPVLGGNASSEVRLWVLGATAHMSNNNRWAREGGIVDEILVENLWRNPEGNAILFDAVLLDVVAAEPNLDLFLNTAISEVTVSPSGEIAAIHGFNSQNSIRYDFRAPLFCDATGDGIVGFLAGAPYRIGAEESSEFGEGFAPDAGYGFLLGHTIMLHGKDMGRPVTYVAPDFALSDITAIPRYETIRASQLGCTFWWFEYGGRLDTIHDTETIKWELWRVVYGVWDYIKNSGRFPEAENLALEWAGPIPGKRESRRFEGDHMLTQDDLVSQRPFEDAVSFGGWSLDLHPADGVYSDRPGCNQWHSHGVYPIPYRCLYSRSISNLFLAGRLISASHVAFGSTRVMATCAHSAQAVGVAAALCRETDCLPRTLTEASHMKNLQRRLLRTGQWIPNVALDDPDDLVQSAAITATSRMKLGTIPPDGPVRPLDRSVALLVPLSAGAVPSMAFQFQAEDDTTLSIELRVSERIGHYTPDQTLAVTTLEVKSGAAWYEVDFQASLDSAQYGMVCLMANAEVSVSCSAQQVTGVLSLRHAGEQPERTDLGFHGFEIWRPERRPGEHLPACRFAPSLDTFEPAQLANGFDRPWLQANAWVADLDDPEPAVHFTWTQPQSIRRMVIAFDTDFDHPMESHQFNHPERVVPYCVRNYRVCDREGRVLHRAEDNHQTRNVIEFDEPIVTDQLTMHVEHPSSQVPAAVFSVRCYG